MKEQVDKDLDDLTKKVVKEVSVETPSFDFTDVVMSRVFEIENNKATLYKPLISTKRWLFIMLGFICLIFYVIRTTQGDDLSWINITEVNNKIIEAISGIKISKTFSYAIVLFSLMFCIHIPFLKNYLDKRLEF